VPRRYESASKYHIAREFLQSSELGRKLLAHLASSLVVIDSDKHTHADAVRVLDLALDRFVDFIVRKQDFYGSEGRDAMARRIRLTPDQIHLLAPFDQLARAITPTMLTNARRQKLAKLFERIGF